jgi:hypothetical protein
MATKKVEKSTRTKTKGPNLKVLEGLEKAIMYDRANVHQVANTKFKTDVCNALIFLFENLKKEN